MTLEDLARWHRAQAKATTGADRELHLAAVRLITGVLKQRADHTASIREGLAKAREEGRPTGGAPRVEAQIQKMLKAGAGTRAIMSAVGCGAAAVVRVKKEMGLALGKPGRPAGE
jgi:hypothetical protein